MKKSYLIIVLAALLVLSVASCQKDIMLPKLNFTITLDEANTYETGDSLLFHINGDVDNVVFFSGEVGHQYKLHDRYILTAADVDTMRLTINVQHRTGNDAQALEIYYSNTFEGLNGDDAEADMLMIKEMYEGGMQGWKQFPYEEHGAKSGVYYDYVLELEHECIDNLCIAFYWNPSVPYSEGSTERADTYWVTGDLYMVINEVQDPRTYDLRSLVGTAVMMNEIDGSYYYQDRGDGSIQLNATAIAFQGGVYADFGHSCEGWLFSYPTAFNDVEPDLGTVAKSLILEQYDYRYTYYSPGDYLATFVCTNANYMGGYRQLVEIPLTITGEEKEAVESGDEEAD